MDFAIFSDFLDSVRTAKSHPEKAVLTRNFMKNLRQEPKERVFKICRLLLPNLDRERKAYRIKESKISRLLIKMLDLPQGSTDRDVLSKTFLSGGVDFGDVIFSVLKKYIVNQKTCLNIENINEYLDRIANRDSDSGLDDLVLEIFNKLSPKATKWFIQILLKNLKLGISDSTILKCYHEDADDYYSLNNNLRKVCDTFYNSETKLHELEIDLFEPFRPMLSKRCDANNFKKCFPDEKRFFIENKFDGERFQLHYKESEIKLFSRNGFNFTDSLRDNFINHLSGVFSSDMKNVILDGELMLFNTNTQKFGSKGMNLDVKKLSKGKYKPCYCVFDVLLYNGRVLTNEPLIKRIQLLRKIVVNPKPDTILLSEYKESRSRDDIVAALNTSVDNNEEGIVVKDPKSIYKCADRNSGWFKIKMEYFDDVVHDLDVLLMGGFYGNTKKINSFIVGVASDNTFLSLGKISSGLNDEQLDMLNEKLKSSGLDFNLFATNSKGKLQFGREVPDIYIEPEKSCVLQIRATELIRSTSDFVKTPYTLRFPRVLKIREDKNANECLSINELLELTGQNKSVIKLNKRHIELGEIVSKTKNVKKIKLEVVNKMTHLNAVGDFLAGKRFYVLSGSKEWPIEDVYNSIKKAGGEIVYKLDSNTDVVLASEIDQKVLKLMKQANYFDIVRIDWLKRAFDKCRLVSYDFGELISSGTSFRRDLSDNLDIYGDCFNKDTNREDLEKLLEQMTHRDDYFNANNAVVVD